jgi:hypothetical protein
MLGDATGLVLERVHCVAHPERGSAPMAWAPGHCEDHRRPGGSREVVVGKDSPLVVDQGRWLESALRALREAEFVFRALDRFSEPLDIEQALRVRDLATEAAIVASRLRFTAERRIAELRREETLLARRVIPLAARREPDVES